MGRLRAIGARLGRVPGWVPALVGWLLVIAYAYPGQMTRDSFTHLAEARAGFFTDWHPPAIDWIWRWVDRVIRGQLGMLLLQTGTFVGGLYLVLRRVLPRAAGWVTAAIALFPPVLTTMAVIWKDSLMAGCLVLGIGMLLSERRAVRVGALAVLFVASALRYNAAAATVAPIVVLFTWRAEIAGRVRYAISVGAWAAVTLAAMVWNRALTDQKMYAWHASVAVFDIVGTYVAMDETVPDAEIEKALIGTNLHVHQDIHAAMRKLYTPRDYNRLTDDQRYALWDLPVLGSTPAPAEQRDAIASAWKRVVSAHPGAYVEHRVRVMTKVLGIGARTGGAVVPRSLEHLKGEAATLHVSTSAWGWQSTLTSGTTWLWKHTPLFSPWVYLLAALAALGVGRRQREVVAIVASGVVYEGTLLVLAPCSDFRYSHWLVVTALLAAAMVVARRRGISVTAE